MTSPAVAAARARLEIVQTAERLQEIGPAWEALWNESGAFVFQSHAWIAAWWRAAPDRRRRRLRIVLAWKDDTLEAVLPLAICRSYGVRVLEWAAKDYSDYCDALLRPGVDRTVVRQMWDHIAAQGGFDAAYLGHLLPTAVVNILTAGNGATRVALRPHHRQTVSLRIVGPWPDGQSWFDTHSGNARRNYRRGLKTLAENAKVEFRLLPHDEPLGPVLRRCAELKRAWCVRNGLVAPLFDADSPMLAALVQVLADKKLLHIFVIERDGVVIAVTVNFMQHNTMMAYVTTYDATFERSSPGNILLFDYIRWSIDHGATSVDFLSGGEDYKYRFADTQIALRSVAGGRTMLGAAAIMADRLHHAVKTFRTRSQGRGSANADDRGAIGGPVVDR